MSNETETQNNEYWEKLRRMVFRRCKDILHNTHDADDATQEVFENFLNKESHFEIRPKGFGGLFIKMAGYMSLNQLRENRRDACRFYALATNVSLNRVRDMGTADIYNILFSPEKGKSLIESDGFSDDSEQVVDRLFVEAILKEEDEKTRDIYFMRYRDNMTFEEIGEVVGLSTAAVHKRLVKLENEIRLILDKDQNDGK